MMLRNLFTPQNHIKTGDLESILRGLIGGQSKSGISVTPETALRCSAVYACVKVISETVAQLPLILYKRMPNGGRERATGHYLTKVIGMKPNNFQTSFSFREMGTAHALLRGNAYALKNRVGSKILGLIPFPADAVQVKQLANMERQYTVTLANELRTYSQDDMFHLVGMTLNGWEGVSVLRYAKESIGLSLATEMFGNKVFANGAKMSGILTYPGKFKHAETAQQVGKDFDSATNGENAHNTVVLDNGMKWEKVSMTSDDAQFLETRAFQIPEIARFFRMPLHKIQELSRATFSNIEQQALEFLTDCMMPWLVRWEQSLNTQLLSDKEQDDFYFEFLVDGLLRGDIRSRYEAYARAVLTGFMNRNEVRIRENMNPADGLDAFLEPTNMIESGTSQDGQNGSNK